MAAIPCIPHALSARLAHLGMGFCNATKASWFSLDYLNSFFSMIMLIVPLFWSYFLYVLQHINTPLQKSLMAFEKPPSVLSALYYVLRPCPSLICVGHVLGPAASIFSLWFSPWPPSWLHSGALLSPHPGGRRTHLSHFWVPACCMFSGAAECNNVAWRNSRFFPLTTHIVVDASCSGLSRARCWIAFPETMKWFTPALVSSIIWGVLFHYTSWCFYFNWFGTLKYLKHTFNNVWYCVLLHKTEGVNYAEYILQSHSG